MNERKAKDVIDVFEMAEKISVSRPPLPEGLLPSYLKTIDWIYQLSRKGRVRVSDLADAMKLTRPGITRNCNAMEKMGLIRKKASSSDRRIVYVELSEEGKAFYHRYVEKYYVQLSERLSVYEGEKLDNMIEMIRLIYEDLSSCPINMGESKK